MQSFSLSKLRGVHLSASARKKKEAKDLHSLRKSRLKIVDDSNSLSNPERFDEIFNRLFRVLHSLIPNCEVAIAVSETATKLNSVSHSKTTSSSFLNSDSEKFANLFLSLKFLWATKTLSTLKGCSFELPSELATQIAGSQNGHVLKGKLDLFKEMSEIDALSQGPVALFSLSLGDNSIGSRNTSTGFSANKFAVIAITAEGRHKHEVTFSDEKRGAIQAIIEVATLAACASDLSQDVQVQQNQFNILKSEIAEVQQFYRQFSESIQQCFWVADIETGRPLIISDNFERVWGTKSNILSNGLTGFMMNVFPADRDRVLSDFYINLGKEFNSEFRVIGENNEVHWVWLRAFPTDDDLSLEKSTAAKEGQPQFLAKKIVLIADDITEKKVSEETLRSREADLVTRARMLAVSDLASGVAHEINNPLTVIVGKAAEIKRLIDKPETVKTTIHELADKIQTTSIRISEIIKSLKSLSRNEKNVAIARTSLRKIFHEVRDLCGEKFKNSSTALDLSDLPEDLYAEMNSTMISQLILNLLNNAFDAVADMSERWVKVEYTENVDSVFIFVTDSGSGIPIKIRSRIFDPFFTTKEPGRGTGLGLSLAASIAAHHNGILRVDTMHPYTRFVLQLPKKQPR